MIKATKGTFLSLFQTATVFAFGWLNIRIHKTLKYCTASLSRLATYFKCMTLEDLIFDNFAIKCADYLNDLILSVLLSDVPSGLMAL